MKRFMFVAVAMLLLALSVSAQELDARLVTEGAEAWVSGNGLYEIIFKPSGICVQRTYKREQRARYITPNAPRYTGGGAVQSETVWATVFEKELIGRWSTNEGKLVITAESGFDGEYLIRDGGNSLVLEPEGRAVLLTKGMSRRATSEERLASNNKFLENNKKRAGVITTESGLQYEILENGVAQKRKPRDNDYATIRCELSLIDGTEIELSYINRSDERSAQVKNFIRGVAEGVKLMDRGATYRFYIPPHLAYGEGGHGSVPPNSALIVKVKLERSGMGGYLPRKF